MSDTHRRRKTLRLPMPTLLYLLRSGRKSGYEVADGIPADARVVAVRIGHSFAEADADTLCLLVESTDFAPVVDGEPIPQVDVVFKRSG